MERHSNIFKQFMLSYIYILALPLCACFLFFGMNNHTLNLQSAIHYKNEIEKAVIEANNTFVYMSTCATQLAANNTLNEYVDITQESKRSTKSIQVINLLSNYMTTDSKVSNIYLYTPHNDYLLTPAGGFDVRPAYNNAIKWGELSYEQLRSDVLLRNNFIKLMDANDYFFLDSTDDYVVCLHSVPMGSADITGQFIIMSKKDDLLNFFKETIDIPLNINLYDKKGGVLLSCRDIENNKELTAYRFSHQLVDYEVFADPDSYKEGYKYLKQILMLIMGLFLFISAVVAFFVIKKNISPVDKFLSQVSKNNGNEYINSKNLEGLFDKIAKRETVMSDELALNHEKSKSNLMNLLFKGEFENDDELNEQMELLNINFKHEMYITTMVEFVFDEAVSYKELFAAKMLFNKTLSNSLKFLSMDFKENIEVFIFAFDKNIETENITFLEEGITRAVRLFKGRETIRFKFAVSHTYHSLIDAFGTFEETRNSLSNGIQTLSENIIWCTIAEEIARNSYYFPARLKQNMKFALKAGNNEEFNKALDRLLYFNQTNIVLMKSEIEGLIHELKLLIQSSMAECRIDDESKSTIILILDKIRNDSLHPNVFEKFKTIADMIVKSSVDKTEQNDALLASSLIDYVYKNYQNPDFNRHSLSEFCKLSPDYASKYFKSKVGENFSEYLERIRIDEACKLLLKNKKIEMVARSVGYASDGSFRRAFKKIMGITPTQYLNNYKQGS